MAVKLTLMVEGGCEEIEPILKFLSETRNDVVITQKPIENDVQIDTVKWTEDKISVIWSNITLDCKNVLREIAKHEEGISLSRLMKVLDLTGNSIGGRLSSLGHQIRIHNYMALPNVFLIPDNYSFGYKLSPIWRQTITKTDAEMEEFLRNLDKDS